MSRKTIALIVLAIFVMSILPTVFAARPTGIEYNTKIKQDKKETKSFAELAREKAQLKLAQLREYYHSRTVSRLGEGFKTPKKASKLEDKFKMTTRRALATQTDKSAEQERLQQRKEERSKVKTQAAERRTMA